MKRLREILLTLAVISSLATAWAQSAGKPVYQQSDPTAENYMKNRVALVGSGVTKDNLSGNLSISWVENLDNLTNEDLNDYVTFVDGVSAAIAVQPIVGVRDTKHHYAAGTSAGFRVMTSSDSKLLSLDVIKLYSIVFYCEGKQVGTSVCNNSKEGGLLGLGLLSFSTGDAAVDLVANAPNEFDEIHLMPAGGINVDAITSTKVQYGFVGDPYKYTLTNQGAGNPRGIEEYCADFDRNLKLYAESGLEKSTSTLSNSAKRLIDADLTNNGPGTVLGNMSCTVTAQVKDGGDAPFKAGADVGFHYIAGSVLKLDLGKSSVIELLDADGQTLQKEHLNTTVVNLGLASGGSGDFVIKANQDFHSVKLTFAGVSVDLGSTVARYFYVTPNVKKASDLPNGSLVVTCESVTYDDDGNANVVASVTATDSYVTVSYIGSSEEIQDIEKTSEGWTEVTPGDDGKYTFDVSAPNSEYIYIKATDSEGNVYLLLERNPTDNIKPTCTINPEGTVCNRGCQVTVTDNRAIKSIQYSTDGGNSWINCDGFTYNDQKPVTTQVVNIAKPESNDGNTPVQYSFKVTDESNKENTYLNVVKIYPDHVWTAPQYVMVRKDDGSFAQYTYYECANGCTHIWDVAYLGEPDNYKHTSTETDPTTKEHQEQGLTPQEAAETLFSKCVEALVTKDYEDIIMREYDINAAIDAINDHSKDAGKDDKSNPYYIVITGDINVCGDTSTPQIAPPNDGVKAIVDLNGYGLRVNGDAYAGDGKSIKGHSDVSILLTDDGELEYTNASRVTGTPVLYRRILFSPYQKGSWQSLFLPFDCSTIPSTVKFGTIDGVDLKDAEATLYINYHNRALDAFKHYLVRAHDDFELHPTNSTLYPYKSPVKDNISTSGYTISGSLKNTDHKATESSTFWVLTNDGNFWYSAPDNHQRPYRWVIFNKSGSAHAPQTLTLSINGADGDADGIAPIVAEGPCTTPDVYSLSGMRMPDGSHLPTGLYVVDGKKIFVW